MTVSINNTQHNNALLYAECHFAECRILFTFMLNVVMLSVVMLNVIMLSVIMLSVGGSILNLLSVPLTVVQNKLERLSPQQFSVYSNTCQ